MESLNKLRMLEEKFKKVVVVHDMTPKERHECKEMVQEAKRLESQESGGGLHVQGSRQPRHDEDYKNPKKNVNIYPNITANSVNEIKCNSRKENCLNILYTNADTLFNTITELKLTLNSMKNKPKIIAVTEVKQKKY